MRKSFFSVVALIVLFGARTGRCDVFSEMVGNPAYKVDSITEEEYKADESGQVFSSYDVAGEKPVAQYWRYELVNKTYDVTSSGTSSGEGDGTGAGEEGDIATVNIGLGLNNSADLSGIDNVLYKNNAYFYNYTGDRYSVILRGGALYNSGDIGTKGGDGRYEGVSLNADFIGNKVTSAVHGLKSYIWVEGVSVANLGSIGNIEGNFIGNYGLGDVIEGVGIYNSASGSIQSVNGGFLRNTAIGRNVKGGAVFNAGNIGEITGDFIANSLEASVQANGGVIQNNDARANIDIIRGKFVNNSAIGGAQAWGGAIDNNGGNIGKIFGVFNNNLAFGNGSYSDAIGGAISNQGNISEISGDFIANTSKGTSGAYGGAIYSDTVLDLVSGNFVGNRAEGDAEAYGGAIYYEGNGLVVYNSNFYNNAVVSSSDDVFGGAIYADNLKIEAEGENSIFSGNTVNQKSNALYIENGGKLGLSTTNKGNIIFEDDISGENYDINVSGDGSGITKFNGKVEGVNGLYADGGAIIGLGTAARVDAKHYEAAQSGSVLQLDVMIDSSQNTVKNGVINVDGDISGKTNIVINSLNQDKLKDTRDVVSVFLNAPNDTILNDEAFKVSRVIGSPYAWDAFRNYKGETNGSTWYLGIKNDAYMPEIPAYAGMQTALIEQNRGLAHKISEGMKANCNKGCRFDRKSLYPRLMWANADYSYAEVDSPSEMDVKIQGVTGGFDLMGNFYQHLGVFGRYSQGDYDLSGKGKFRSDYGSDLDVDGYLGGVYFYQNKHNWEILATLFAGKQDIEMRVDDGSLKADTNSMIYGGSLDISHRITLPYAWAVEPGLGIYYALFDTDDFSDTEEQRVEFDLMHYMEIDLGLRVEHLFCVNGKTAKVYAKPSIIQTFSSGSDMRISMLSSSSSYKNQTLGRMKIGAKFGLSSELSTYLSADYTYGSNYSGYGVDAGLTYSW